MIIGRAPMHRYPIRQDPKQALQNSGRLLRNIRNINGLVLPIYKIGLQMQFLKEPQVIPMHRLQ